LTTLGDLHQFVHSVEEERGGSDIATDNDKNATLGDIVLGSSTIQPEDEGGRAFGDSVLSICMSVIDLRHWSMTSMISL